MGLRKETAIFYESPYRVKQAVAQIAVQLGGETRVVIGRELTKRYEEFIRGGAQEMSEHLKDRELKGEVVLLIEGGMLEGQQEEEFSTLPYKEHVELIMATKGIQSKDAIKEVAKIRQVKKQDVYSEYHNLT